MMAAKLRVSEFLPPTDRAAFSLNFNFQNQDGTIGHFIEMILIDKQGRFVRDYQGKVWSNDAALEDLKKLLTEPATDTRYQTIEPSK